MIAIISICGTSPRIKLRRDHTRKIHLAKRPLRFYDSSWALSRPITIHNPQSHTWSHHAPLPLQYSSDSSDSEAGCTCQEACWTQCSYHPHGLLNKVIHWCETNLKNCTALDSPCTADYLPRWSPDLLAQHSPPRCATQLVPPSSQFTLFISQPRPLVHLKNLLRITWLYKSPPLD
jgi:hypothetical protein